MPNPRKKKTQQRSKIQTKSKSQSREKKKLKARENLSLTLGGFVWKGSVGAKDRRQRFLHHSTWPSHQKTKIDNANEQTNERVPRFSLLVLDAAPRILSELC